MSEPLLRNVSTNVPLFLVHPEPRVSGWWDSVKILAERIKLSNRGSHSYNPLRRSTIARSRLGGRPLSGSFLLHCLGILCLVYLPREFPDTSILNVAPATPEAIYYQPPPPETRSAPRIAPAGPGGRPMSGARAADLPAKGSTDARRMIVIVSKPAQPDNVRQTIVQPKSPDIQIRTELKLPNLITGETTALHAPLQFNPNDSKPIEVHRAVAPTAAPSPEQAAQVASLLTPATFQPQMPVSAAAAPVARSRSSTELDAPQITGNPALGVAGVVALSVDPGTNLAPPPGNRSGEFAVSQDVNPGSPGGEQTATKSGGNGNSGKGGDTSIGVGVNVTGGGGSPGWNLSVSVSGTGKDSSPGSLSANLASAMVYAVPSSFVLRKNELIVSTGPVGGGGLDVYGALNCGKIYTIFLSMPMKSWTMQYCVQFVPAVDAKTPSQAYATVVHLGQGLVPPQAEAKFDFKRVPVPPAMLHKQIVLKGTLDVDGTVSQIQVYQGIEPQMDEAARLALARWKFKPALRDGKAIPVQVLVGIPVEGAGSNPPGE